jgi:Tfp pilus assembly protein FimT
MAPLRRARSSSPPQQAPEAGYSLTGTIVVAALIAIMLAVAVPGMKEAYARQQQDAAAILVQSTVQRARISALKEKRAYRVVLHDENGSPANTVELQREVGGTFTTVDDAVHPVPGAVRILGASPQDSVDSVTVNSRGECNSGNVFMAASGQSTSSVAIDITCFAEKL